MLVLTIPLYALTFQGGLDSEGRPMGTDFIAFWSAAKVTVDGLGVDPWSLRELQAFQLAEFPGLSGPTAWVYPPTTLLLVWPLGHLTFAPAFIVWTIFGLVAFLGCLRFVVRGQRLAWPLVLAFPGLWIGIAHGQTQFVVAALMGGALLALARHPVAAGVLIGLMAVKPHLAILFPVVLVAGGHWRTFVSAAVTALGAFGVGVLAFGVESVQAWFNGMSLVGAAIDQDALPVYKFVTPYTSFRLLGLPETLSLVLHTCAALPVIWIVWTLWRRTDSLPIRGAALVTATFIVTPYAADYDLAALAFPIAWITLTGLRDGWLRGDRNLLVAAWILPSITAPIAAVSHFCITPVVLGLLLLQLWRRAESMEHDERSTQSADGG